MVENLPRLYNMLHSVHTTILEKYRNFIVEELGERVYEDLRKRRPLSYSLIVQPGGTIVIFDYGKPESTLALVLYNNDKVKVKYFENVLFSDAVAETFDSLERKEEGIRLDLSDPRVRQVYEYLKELEEKKRRNFK